MPIKVINKDILLSECDFIAHQCNCVTKKSRGLAKAIFDKYPQANTYSNNYNRILGEISIHGKIINMYAQKYPGGSKSEKEYNDRLKYFKSCLKKINREFPDKSIAMPYNIGCGLAKGKWKDYKKIIKKYDNIVLHKFP